MGQPGGGEPARWWDPLGVWSEVTPPFPVPPLGPGVPGVTAVTALVDQLRTALVGRPVTLGTGDRQVSFTLTSLEGRADPMAAASGQIDDVSVAAVHVAWQSYRFDSVTARLANVHTRFRALPVLVSAPIDVTVVLASEEARRLVGRTASPVDLEITEHGEVCVRWRRHPRLGWVEAQPEVENGSISLRPKAFGRGGRRRLLKRRWPAVRPGVAVPEPFRITRLHLRPDVVEVGLRVDEWRLDYRALTSLVRRRQA